MRYPVNVRDITLPQEYSTLIGDANMSRGATTKEDRCIGPPGTGKTTFLTQVISYNAQQYGSDNVIAVSHTRAAAAELAGRNTPIARSNIGTLHSFAYHAIGTPPLAETPDSLREFVDEHPQWTMSALADPEDVSFSAGGNEGDKAMQEYQRYRNLCAPREAWPFSVIEYATAWEDFKQQTGRIDFSDMIELATTDTECAVQEPAVIVADECQDTSRLQWRLLEHWTADAACEKFVTAGDQDQAIFVWAGADSAYFTDHPPMRRKVLEQSYRVPRAVHALAMDWISKVTDREDVSYLPRDAEGAVHRTAATYKYPDPLLPVIEDALDKGQTVMIQATCGYMLRQTIDMLRREAIPFANPWRTKGGSGWNPLLPRGKASTVGAVREFLRPHLEGRLWDKASAEAWLAVLRGVFVHGGKKRFAENTTDRDTEDEVLERIAQYLSDEADLSRLLAPPPACLDWFDEHLLASKAQAAQFPLHIARERGVQALLEEPRVYVGSMHSFKGAEADVNIVLPDLSYAGYAEWLGNGRNDILRLLYVAITRTRETLYLGSSCTGMGVWS